MTHSAVCISPRIFTVNVSIICRDSFISMICFFMYTVWLVIWSTVLPRSLAVVWREREECFSSQLSIEDEPKPLHAVHWYLIWPVLVDPYLWRSSHLFPISYVEVNLSSVGFAFDFLPVWWQCQSGHRIEFVNQLPHVQPRQIFVSIRRKRKVNEQTWSARVVSALLSASNSRWSLSKCLSRRRIIVDSSWIWRRIDSIMF